jgi:predicted Zn-dependent protease
MFRKKMLTSMAIFLSTFFVSIASYGDLNLDLPDMNLPDLGGGGHIATQEDRNNANRILRLFRSRGLTIEDPELNSWIRSLGTRLASHAPGHGNLYFILAKNPEVNAFATSGGVIVINSGLVLYTETESELAAVVAHEIAHVTQNHLARMKEKSRGNVLGTSAAILAGLAAGSQNPQAGGAIITSAMAAQMHQQLSYSRGMESEADRVGLRILASSGFKANGMPRFMEKLERLNDNPDAALTKYLQSHPLSLERVSDTRVRARRFGNRGREDVDYLYAREKIRALAGVGSQTQIPVIKNPAVKKYAQAMKLKRTGNSPAALRLLGTHSRKVPEAIAIATLLNEQRKYSQAISVLQPLARVYPGQEGILVPLANAYLGAGQAQQAWQLLKKVVPSEQTSLGFFEVRQEVAGAVGEVAEAYSSAAERNIRIGENNHAKAQLRKAMKMPGVSASDIARLQRRLDSLK